VSHADESRALQTERLVLEPLAARHAAALFDALSDPSLYPFVPDDPPATLAALEARFRRLEARRSPDGRQEWLNWAARDARSDAYVGWFQATVDGGVALLAYFVFAPFQRRGFAREGASAVIERLAASGVHSFAADIDTRNAASIALVRSLGFTLSRTTPNADSFKGSISDEHRFVLDRTAER
jgi:RimJ/RimL family protein N-acetyltransferase